MSDEKTSVWGYILSVLGGFVLGLLTYLGLRRNRVSDEVGERVDSTGQQLDKVVNGVTGAEERNRESVGTVGELAEESRAVADSVGRISEGADSLEDGIEDARGSVGRLKDLIRQERERIAKAHSKE
jgi:methyl-accepting chemotaxis protein